MLILLTAMLPLCCRTLRSYPVKLRSVLTLRQSLCTAAASPSTSPSPSVTTTSQAVSSETSASTPPSSQSDRIHSTDIAFKPNSAGWGYSVGYAKGFDSIFKKKATESSSSRESVQSNIMNSDINTLLNNFETLSHHDKAIFVSSLLEKYPEFSLKSQ